MPASTFSGVNGRFRSLTPVAAKIAFAIAGIVGAVLLRYLFEQHCQRERELAESQARLQALQARIRPHFLFNSMNTIASLTRSNPQKAEEAVEDLSDLLRVTLQSPSDMSSLQQELEIAKTYERIEKLRLDDRLSVRWELSDVPQHVRLPTFTIQPLLENAIYHGIELLPDGGEIVVQGQRSDDVCVIELTNPVVSGPQRNSDGNKMAEISFKNALAVEEVHAGMYAEALASAKDGNDLPVRRKPLAP